MARDGQSALLVCLIIIAGVGSSCARPAAKLEVSDNRLEPREPAVIGCDTRDEVSEELNGENVEKVGIGPAALKPEMGYRIIAVRWNLETRDDGTVRADTVNEKEPLVALRSEPSGIECGSNLWLQLAAENRALVDGGGLGEPPIPSKRGISPHLSAIFLGTAADENRIASADLKGTTIGLRSGLQGVSHPSGGEFNTTRPFCRLATPIYFDSNQADLKPSEQARLQRIAQWLLEDERRAISFRIEGDCDKRGTEAYHLGLGGRRARKTREFLAGFMIDLGRVEITSYGTAKACEAIEGLPKIIPTPDYNRHRELTYLGKR